MLYLVFKVQLRECSDYFKKSLVCQEQKSVKPLSRIVRESLIEGDRIKPLPDMECRRNFANLAKNTYSFAQLAILHSAAHNSI